MQNFLWSGSVQNLLHPTLFQRLGIVENLFKYNRFYLSSDVFSYNVARPKLSKITLPKLQKPLYRVVLDYEDVGADEDELYATCTQLAVTPRVFYRAFGGKQYNNVLKACYGLSSTARLLISTKSSFFAPLYNSKSMVIACNILNMMFMEMFDFMGIQSEQQADFFSKLQDAKVPSHPRIIKASRSSIDIDTLLEIIFSLGQTSFLTSTVRSNFYELWQHAYKVVHELNE